MAQGDAVNQGANGSTAANTTDTIDITATSGNHVCLHSIRVGAQAPINNRDAGILSRDTVAGVDWGGIEENQGFWVGEHNSSALIDDQYTGKIFIDDSIGLRAIFQNADCLNHERSYAVSGQEVK